MKSLKALPLLASAITLSVAIASTLPAFAQSTSPTLPAQRDHMHRPNFLNLTSDQQAQMKQIWQNARSQIDTILTDEQRAQLQRERDNHRMSTPRADQGAPRPEAERGRPHSPFASLNLTAEQQSQIEAIMRSSKEQMDAILTPEQRQQLQQHQHQQPVPAPQAQ